MMSPDLPSVLQDPRGSLSMERALKQMKELLENWSHAAPGTLKAEENAREQDRINASIDDIDTMLEHIR